MASRQVGEELLECLQCVLLRLRQGVGDPWRLVHVVIPGLEPFIDDPTYFLHLSASRGPTGLTEPGPYGVDPVVHRLADHGEILRGIDVLGREQVCIFQRASVVDREK
jgi:hypothetical protein